MMLNMKFSTKMADFLVLKWALINDYGLRDTIPIDDIVLDKPINLCAGNVCHRNGFNPLRKILSGSDNEFVSIR